MSNTWRLEDDAMELMVLSPGEQAGTELGKGHTRPLINIYQAKIITRYHGGSQPSCLSLLADFL